MTKAKVKGGRLNLRAEATTASKVLEIMEDGTALEVIEEGPEWTKVKENDREGYVMTRYLEFDAPVKKTPPAKRAGVTKNTTARKTKAAKGS